MSICGSRIYKTKIQLCLEHENLYNDCSFKKKSVNLLKIIYVLVKNFLSKLIRKKSGSLIFISIEHFALKSTFKVPKFLKIMFQFA